MVSGGENGISHRSIERTKKLEKIPMYVFDISRYVKLSNCIVSMSISEKLLCYDRNFDN